MHRSELLLSNGPATAQAAATITILIGFSELGWVFGIQPQTSIIFGSVEMKINTATGILLSNASWLILSKHPSLDNETEQQASRLQALGCDQAQGYLFGRPVAADDITKRLAHAAAPEISVPGRRHK